MYNKLLLSIPATPMAATFQMSPEAKRRVIHRVTQSGALPVSRDAPGYTAVLDVLGIANCSEEEGGAGARLGRNNGDVWAGAATDTIVGSFSSAGEDTLGFVSHRVMCVFYWEVVFMAACVILVDV